METPAWEQRYCVITLKEMGGSADKEDLLMELVARSFSYTKTWRFLMQLFYPLTSFHWYVTREKAKRKQ